MQDERNTDDRDEDLERDKPVDFYDPWQQAFSEEMKRPQYEFDF